MRPGVLLWLAFLPVAAAVRAAEPPPPFFDIPASDAETALRRFTQQAGVELVYRVDAVAGVRTRPVRGRHQPLDALLLMFAATPITAVQDPVSGALALKRIAAPALRGGAAARAPPPSLQTAGPAPAGGDETITLPRFTVTTPPADRYRPLDTVSAARIRGELADTPLSIAVVTEALLHDVGAESMYDATRYFSGVSNGRGAGPGGILDRQDFRGFESFTRTVDGLSTINLPGNNGFQANFEPEFVDRIEVVKGPDSILSPTGSPGGSINVITKSPQAKPATVFTTEVGNYNAGKVSWDSTGPVPFDGTGRWTYRVIADYQDARTYVPGSLRQWDLSTQLRFQVTSNTEITVKYFGQQWELTGAIADPNDDGWYVVDPKSVGGAAIGSGPSPGSGFTYDGWNGDTTWSSRYDRVNLLTGEMTAALFDKISMRLAAAVTWDNFDQDAGYLSAPPPTEYWNAETGQETAIGPFDPANLTEIANHVKSANRDEQVQNDFAANFHPGGVSLQPVVGWTYQQGTNPPNYDKTAPLPNIDLLSSLPYDPPRPAASSYTYATDSQAHAWQSQVYGVAKAGFYDDRVFLLAGASRLWTRNAATNLLTGGTVALQGDHDTYLGGALAKPVPALSLYYVFSSNASITTGPQDQPLWQTGKQDEFGAKYGFFGGKLALTAAHFQIVQSNLSTPNPLYNTDPAHNPSDILTDETSHGFEWELVGALTDQISLIASHTDMKLRDAYGRRQRNVPDTMSALLMEYRFGGWLRTLAAYAGVIHTGDTAGETVTGFTPLGVPEQPGFTVPAWTVANAGLGCRRGRYRVDLNADNLLNARFPWQPAGRNSVSPYPGLTLRLRTSVSW